MTITSLSKDTNKLFSQLDKNFSYYVKFINTNEVIEHNSDKQFWAASLIKIPIALYLFDQASKDKINLDDWINIKDQNYVDGSGITQLLDNSTKYKIKDLVMLMFSVSDNSAANELVDLLGWENIDNYIKNDLELSNTFFKHKLFIKAGRGPNLTCTKDMNSVLEKLYSGDLHGSDEILKMMNQEKDRRRIPLLLPNKIDISHKVGNLYDGTHDVGIVFSKNPFIICLMCDDQKNKRLIDQVYSEVTMMCFKYSNS
jgi:beta-lactamase class A